MLNDALLAMQGLMKDRRWRKLLSFAGIAAWRKLTSCFSDCGVSWQVSQLLVLEEIWSTSRSSLGPPLEM